MSKKIKLLVEVDKEILFKGFEQPLTEEERMTLVRAVGNGIQINEGDMISREGMKNMVDGWLNMDKYYHPYSKGKTIPTDEVYDLIDNAPIVGGNQKGKWFEHIDKGLLKARHGNYVLYKVDFLLDNLAREVNIMESVRQMRGDENGKS